jgi:hypothetical protein
VGVKFENELLLLFVVLVPGKHFDEIYGFAVLTFLDVVFPKLAINMSFDESGAL